MNVAEMRQRMLDLARSEWRLECGTEGIDALLKEIGAPLDDEHRQRGFQVVIKIKHAGKARVIFGSGGVPTPGQPTPSRLVYFGPIGAELPSSFLLRAYGPSAVRPKRRAAHV